MILRLSRTIRHRENHARSNRTCQLDGLFDLLVSRTKLLRTCEVRNRSRLAMQSEYEGQVHQLFCLGVENAGGVRLLEVISVSLA